MDGRKIIINKKKVLCYGDSNTFGFNSKDGSRYDENTRWTAVLQKNLGAEYKVINEGMPNRTGFVDNPYDLFEYLLEVWCKETSYPSCQEGYCYEVYPTLGQCAITAMLVYDIFWGTIHKIYLEGGGTHYFNKINDKYIDLTSDQFFGFGYVINYEPNEEVPVEYCCKSQNTSMRFNLLLENLICSFREK